MPAAVGGIVAEFELPQSTGSMWEEWPPQNYEWQIPAIATGAANSGLHVFVTQSSAVSTTYLCAIIFSE